MTVSALVELIKYDGGRAKPAFTHTHLWSLRAVARSFLDAIPRTDTLSAAEKFAVAMKAERALTAERQTKVWTTIFTRARDTFLAPCMTKCARDSKTRRIKIEIYAAGQVRAVVTDQALIPVVAFYLRGHERARVMTPHEHTAVFVMRGLRRAIGTASDAFEFCGYNEEMSGTVAECSTVMLKINMNVFDNLPVDNDEVKRQCIK